MSESIVKPLSWGRDHINKEWNGHAVANTGPHYLVKDDGRWCLRNAERRWVLDQIGDVAGAKEAAQADYETRILSALVTPSDLTKGAGT